MLSVLCAVTLALLIAHPVVAVAQESASSAAEARHVGGGEASLVLPDLTQARFLGLDGRDLLMWGLLICVAGLVFGLINYLRVTRLPVHASMSEVADVILETCKTCLVRSVSSC